LFVAGFPLYIPNSIADMAKEIVAKSAGTIAFTASNAEALIFFFFGH